MSPVFKNPVKHYAIQINLFLVMIRMTLADHTSFCIVLPEVSKKHSGLESPLEYFYEKPMPNRPPPPPPKLNWSVFEDTLRGTVNEAVSVDHVQRHIIKPETYEPPTGDMQIYRVKDKNGEWLNGWYRIEFKLFDTAYPTDPERTNSIKKAVKLLLLSVTDDAYRRQNIGEFVWNFPTTSPSCPASDATKYMVIPCGGASRADPLVPNMIVYLREDLLPISSQGRQIVPVIDDARDTLNFYVRIPVLACNTKRHLQFQARIILDRQYLRSDFPDWIKAHKITRILWIGYHDVPGGSDALPSPADAAQLDCGQRIDKWDFWGPNMPWFSRGECHDAWGRDCGGLQIYIDGADNYYHLPLIACQANYFEGRCKDGAYEKAEKLTDDYTQPPWQMKPMFRILNQNEAMPEDIPICESTFEYFVPYDVAAFFKNVHPMNYYGVDLSPKNAQDYLKDHNVECDSDYNTNPTCVISSTPGGGGTPPVAPPPPPGRRRRSLHVPRHRMYSDNDNIGSGRSLAVGYPRPAVITIAGYLGNNRSHVEDSITGVRYTDEGFTLIIWGMRKGHAILMVLITFLILPINQFFARYMKESFMNKRLLFTRIWYIVHLHGTFLTLAFLISAIVIIKMSQDYLGKSLTIAATFHRVLGWVCIILYVLMAALGGFRGYQEPARKVSIFLHWLVGLTVYFFMLVLCSSAVFIPGSGVTGKDMSFTAVVDDPKQAYTNGAFLFVFAWVIVEIVFHAIMTILMIAHDRRMEITNKRLYSLFIVPIPVLKERNTINATGHGLRVVVLCSYVGVSICAFSIYMIAFIMKVSWRGKGLGPMRCTHEYNSSTGVYNLLEKIPENC